MKACCMRCEHLLAEVAFGSSVSDSQKTIGEMCWRELCVSERGNYICTDKKNELALCSL